MVLLSLGPSVCRVIAYTLLVSKFYEYLSFCTISNKPFICFTDLNHVQVPRK